MSFKADIVIGRKKGCHNIMPLRILLENIHFIRNKRHLENVETRRMTLKGKKTLAKIDLRHLSFYLDLSEKGAILVYINFIDYHKTS